MGKWAERFQDLDVYREAFELAMTLFELSKSFPREEAYSLTDQIRRASRSVAANIAEAWGRRRYAAAFISKMVDAEAEAGETQNWLAFAQCCGYLNADVADDLCERYARLIYSLGSMIMHAESWAKH